MARTMRLLALAAALSLFVGCSTSESSARDDAPEEEAAEPSTAERTFEESQRREVCADRAPRECYFEGMRLEASDKSRQALRHFRAACQQDYMSACYDLGVMHEQGIGPRPNLERARELYEEACFADEPDATACNNLAGLVQDGEGGEEDAGRAAELYERSCELGEMLGCRNLARRYLTGEGVEEDPQRAAELLERACMGGQPEACPQLTYVHAQNCLDEEGCEGDPTDPDASIDRLREGCEEDEEPQACLGHGFLTEAGFGGEADPSAAASHYEVACEEGVPAGCNFLANLHRDGQGVERDVDRAVELYEQACEEGFTLSCHTLGVMHLQGVGVEDDEARGYDYINRACDGGRKASCTALEFQCFLGADAACE